jgi:hypothetical protein
MSDSSITAYNTLQPIVVRTIREAFDDALKEIEQRRGALPECERAKVARHLVEMARHGECSFERLRGAAIEAVPL